LIKATRLLRVVFDEATLSRATQIQFSHPLAHLEERKTCHI